MLLTSGTSSLCVIYAFLLPSRVIKFPTKHNEVISTMCHGVRLALLIPKLFLFSILDLANYAGRF